MMGKRMLQMPCLALKRLARSGLANLMPDKLYLKIKWRAVMGTKLDLKNPKTFNEKIQWLKLYNRKPEYTMMQDKYKAREYVASRIGEEHLIPLLGVWERAEDIDFDALPSQFVLKCNHDCASAIICQDKASFDRRAAIESLKSKLKRNFYWAHREWAYKDISPCIVAEKYISNGLDSGGGGGVPTDYKFMCFNGKHRCTFTVTERFTSEGIKVTFFDKDWHRMPFERHYPQSKKEIPKPKNYDDMVRWSELLAKDIPFARIDFYEADGKVYFGEITLYPGAGYEEFSPKEWDATLGDWLELPIRR